MGATNYHAKPFLSYPICSHEALLTSWDNLNWDMDKEHMLINIGTDGESVRRAVLHSLRKYSIASTSRIYDELAPLEHLDLVTGPGELTFDFDAKHLRKRIRNNLLKGSITILDVKFDAASLKFFYEQPKSIRQKLR